jgi:hypothetical protein
MLQVENYAIGRLVLSHVTATTSKITMSSSEPVATFFGGTLFIPVGEIHGIVHLPVIGRKIDSAINSLRCSSLKLKYPLPVSVEFDGDGFIAEVGDSGIAMAGDTAAEALDLLRDHIIELFCLYSSEANLGPGPKKQLALLERYIAKEPPSETRSRRHRRKTKSGANRR